MNACLREMLAEQAATNERERILAIASHGLDVGKFERAVALAQDPTMTLQRATEILATASGVAP